ncbi:glycosyltransferase [Acetobacter indonesiensis]|uniref:Glycosyl transferase n=1 Tax=Acetobacter indonesiensis TaxID=104101 RepID=A0A252AR79_9PROT|nr:glycosyltransferase [Acetobacter indonesiensis]OUI92409.1 hypothetical protein HK17_10260 [Acetobacter indonesiensis]
MPVFRESLYGFAVHILTLLFADFQTENDFVEWCKLKAPVSHETLYKTLLHYEYLQRTHPSDGRITMAIGCLRLLLDVPTASEPFEFLKNRASSRICHMLLLCTRIHFKNWHLAEQEFTDYLKQYSPFPHSLFPTLAEILIAQTQHTGWIGFSLSGKLQIRTVREIDKQKITVHLDKAVYYWPDLVTRQNEEHTVITLPKGWREAQTITLHHPEHSFFGSSLNVRTVLQNDGFVELRDGKLQGWARYRAEPEKPVKICFSGINQAGHAVRHYQTTAPQALFNIQTLSGQECEPEFCFSINKLSNLKASVFVKSDVGTPLYGSPVPLDLFAEQASFYAKQIAERFPAISCDQEQNRCENPIEKQVDCPTSSYPPVAVIIPVYNGFKATQDCLRLVLLHKDENTRLILVNDASPDPQIQALLADMAFQNDVSISHNRHNLGFPATANAGLRQRKTGEDVILLNSDTLVSANWVSQLQKAAYSKNDIGTATALSNNATIFSYPDPHGRSPIPNETQCAELSQLCADIWDGEVPEVPTAHGFCMYIKATCLDQVGLLREDIFGQGYGEENDFSCRATALGWRHVACLGTYVGHAESQSFKAVKVDLIRRNLSIINDIHKGYDRKIRYWQEQDPLSSFRQKLDLARFHQRYGKQPSIILIMHDRDGGVLRHVGRQAAYHADQGLIPFIMTPETHLSGKRMWRLQTIHQADFPNLSFPISAFAFRKIAEALNCIKLEIHSYIGSGLEKIVRLSDLSFPYDVYIHDYSWFCPQITLSQKQGRYCGEPSVADCQRCLNIYGSRTGENMPVARLRQLSHALFQKADQIIAPSRDAARRIQRQLGVAVTLRPWEKVVKKGELAFPHLPPTQKRTIGILGAIGLEKGYHALLALAELAEQTDYNIEFVLIGFSCDDKLLADTGRVTITGRYKEFEISRFTTHHEIDWFFLPSTWPETWSYVLTQIWMTEKPVIAYDIGAPAERIRDMGGGMLVPLHIPPEKLLPILFQPAAS